MQILMQIIFSSCHYTVLLQCSLNRAPSLRGQVSVIVCCPKTQQSKASGRRERKERKPSCLDIQGPGCTGVMGALSPPFSSPVQGCGVSLKGLPCTA